MKKLTDNGLVEAYIAAIRLQLDHEFIMLLLDEIKGRKITINPYVMSVS